MTHPIKGLCDLLTESAQRAEAVRKEAERIIAEGKVVRLREPRKTDVQFDHDHEQEEGWTA